MPESRQAFKVAAARFFELANRVFSRQTGFFFECKLLFTDKPMVVTEPTIPSARGLGSKLYPSNMPRMLNKDVTRAESFLSTPKLSKRKKSSAGRVP